ncbi:hypothetical protein RUND412_004457 [Rhizina undulata]
MDTIVMQLFTGLQSFSIYSQSIPLFMKASTLLRNYIASEPSLKDIALMLLIAYLTLSILGMVSRYLYSIVIMVMRMVIFTTIAVLGIIAWQKGPQVAGEEFLGYVEREVSKLMQQPGSAGNRVPGV